MQAAGPNTNGEGDVAAADDTQNSETRKTSESANAANFDGAAAEESNEKSATAAAAQNPDAATPATATARLELPISSGGADDHDREHDHDNDNEDPGDKPREEGALTPVQKPLSFTPGRSSWHDAPEIMPHPDSDGADAVAPAAVDAPATGSEASAAGAAGAGTTSKGFDLELDTAVQEPLTDIPNLESPRPRTLDDPYPPEKSTTVTGDLESDEEDDDDDDDDDEDKQEQSEDAKQAEANRKSTIGDDDSAEGWLASMTSEQDNASEGARLHVDTSEDAASAAAAPAPPLMPAAQPNGKADNGGDKQREQQQREEPQSESTEQPPQRVAADTGEEEQATSPAAAAVAAPAAAAAAATAPSGSSPTSLQGPTTEADAEAEGSPIGRPTELAAVLPGASPEALEEVHKVGEMARPTGNLEEEGPSAEVGTTFEGQKATHDPFADEGVPASVTPTGLTPSVAFRFQMFNMAAATELKDAEAIQGPSGPSSTLAKSLSEPLANGRRPDIVFVALPEAPCGAEQLLAACTGEPITSPTGLAASFRPALSCPGGSSGSTASATSRSFGEVGTAWPEREEQACPNRSKASSVMQDGVMRLRVGSPPLEAVQPNSVRRAWFGWEDFEWDERADHGVDVTSKVKTLLGSGKGIEADAALFGDPAPTRSKVLLLEFVEDEEDSSGYRRADCVVLSSATVESANLHRTKVMGLIDGWVGDFIGDLKTVLAFASRRFSQDVAGDIYVPLVDHTVAGIAMPNPKKCFISKTLIDTGAGGLRFMFAAAHFPISSISETLESDDQTEDTLQTSKRALAGALRKVLRDLGRKTPIDEKTVIFLQGDLNSRTILKGGQAHDILKDVLDDRLLQKAIAYNLPGVPKGRWKEIVPNSDTRELPVTYKFTHTPPAQIPNEASSPSQPPPALRLGDVMARSRATSSSTTTPSSAAAGSRPEEMDLGSAIAATEGHDPGAYKQLLLDAGEDFRKAWGISFKPNNFRPFRFPASADRLIYFAADSLCDDLHWELPQGGYHVNYKQGGSDHKPVFLEAILTVRHTGRSVDEDSPMGRVRSRGGTALCAELSELLDGQVIKDSTGTGAMTIWGKARAGWNWTPDSDANSCEICGRAFGIFRRRHHCRLCGCCVCGSCSPDSLRRPLPQLGLVDPCRLCTRCSDLRQQS